MIPKNAFSGWQHLSEVKFSEGLKEIDEGNFYNARLVKEVTIPHSVERINASFQDCVSLETLYIGENLQLIGNSSFVSCESLKKISFEKIPGAISESLKAIGVGAFKSCKSLEEVVFPCPNLESIGDQAFNGCSKLKNADFSNTKIYEVPNGFHGCAFSNVKIVKVAPQPEAEAIKKGNRYLQASELETTGMLLPATVTRIKDEAFSSCPNLEEVDLPTDITYIGSNTFRNTPWMQNWYKNASDGLNYIGTIAFKYVGTKHENSRIIIKEGTTIIAGGLFRDFGSSLVGVSIPNSVMEIGENAFRGCSNLTNIYFPNSMTTIGNYAFDDCKGLTSVTIPDNVTYIGDYAFKNCTNVTDVFCCADPTKLTHFSNSSFDGYRKRIHVPADRLVDFVKNGG